MKVVSFDIAGKIVQYEVDGETTFGPATVLLKQDDNLIAGNSWEEAGYTIEKFLHPDMTAKIIRAAESFINEIVKEESPHTVPFKLSDYHLRVDDDLHDRVIKKLREGFDVAKLPLPVEEIENRVSEVCGSRVTSVNPKLTFQRFYIRIVRPQKRDNNPPHRDVWLDYYRNCVNIYVPLTGSSELSSLPMVPGSHYWSESDIERTIGGAKIKGFTYRVPSVTGSKHPLKFIRPNPAINEFMVFSPYLIHGGGSNEGTLETRSSIEMRFFRKR